MRNEPFFSLFHNVALRVAASCGPKALAVFAAIGAHSNADGRCWPSLTTIAHLCGIRLEETVSQEIEKLVGIGAISRRPRTDAERKRNPGGRFEFSIARHDGAAYFNRVTKLWLLEHCGLKATALGV